MSDRNSEIHVRYNPIVAWVFLVLGGVNALLGLWLLALGTLPFSLLLGVIFIALGLLYLTREYFSFHPPTRTIEVIAPIGSRRLYKPESGADLVVDGGRIAIVRAAGKRKKLPVTRYMARRDEWNAVATAIQERRQASTE